MSRAGNHDCTARESHLGKQRRGNEKIVDLLNNRGRDFLEKWLVRRPHHNANIVDGGGFLLVQVEIN